MNETSKLKTTNDVMFTLDKLHSKAMEDCGADRNPRKTSDALILIESVIKFAHSKKA